MLGFSFSVGGGRSWKKIKKGLSLDVYQYMDLILPVMMHGESCRAYGG